MTKPLSVLSCFSGIAGLCCCGIELAELHHLFSVTQFVELNPYCQKILKKHYPNTRIHDDITTFTAGVGAFDIICGGFPCTNISAAGKQAGIQEGNASGLFYELIRIIRLVRPKYVLLENVSNLLANGMGTVLGQLSEVGYDCEWSCISVASLGGVHKRDRVFLIAYPQGTRRYPPRDHNSQARADVAPISSGDAIANSSRRLLEDTEKTDQGRAITQLLGGSFSGGSLQRALLRRSTELTNTNGKSQSRLSLRKTAQNPSPGECSFEAERPSDSSNGESKIKSSFRRKNAWIPQKLDGNLMRHADLPEWLPLATDTADIPHRKERLMALGNSVSPNQASVVWRRLAEIIERRIAA